jgi:pimeloyl-ACP methyl ester carboxylesterase
MWYYCLHYCFQVEITMTDTNTTIVLLKLAISDAILAYERNYPTYAFSSHRQRNIGRITKIVDETQDPEQLLNDLEDYFSSEDFYTGITDSSVLEDLIAQAVLSIGENLNPFGYSPENHPKRDETPTNAKDDFFKLQYSLADFVHFAMDKYLTERNRFIPKYRKAEINNIREILKKSEENQQLIEKKVIFEENGKSPKRNEEGIRQEIEKALEAFTNPFNSDLKKYIKKALYQYQDNPTKFFQTRAWEPKVPSHPEKIMIFLHGWHDSVNAASQLASEATKKGFKVIAYDHRGHGNDSKRKERGISTDLLRLDFRKFLTHIQNTHPNAELSLVGHSMGGAVLISENYFINHMENVKTVSLFAPAVMSSLSKLLSPFKLFYRNVHDEVQKAQKSSNRFGGNGPSLWGLLNFMRKAAAALAYLFEEADLTKTPVKWHLYSGKKDALVNCSEFEEISGLSEKRDLRFFPRHDHGLTIGRHAGSAIRTMLNDIEPSHSEVSQTYFI